MAPGCRVWLLGANERLQSPRRHRYPPSTCMSECKPPAYDPRSTV
jgi:hypothetical protein